MGTGAFGNLLVEIFFLSRKTKQKYANGKKWKKLLNYFEKDVIIYMGHNLEGCFTERR